MTGPVPITARQEVLLEFLMSCDRSPTQEEMRAAVGLKAKSSAHRLLNGLQERGFVRRLPNRARSVEVVRRATPGNLAAYDDAELIAELERRTQAALAGCAA